MWVSLTNVPFLILALMEYYCSKDNNIAFKIFELGLKMFGDDPRYVLEYLQHLIHLNDDNNTRAVFERTLPAVKTSTTDGTTTHHAAGLTAAGNAMWGLILDYEQKYGDLLAMHRMEKRRDDSLGEGMCFHLMQWRALDTWHRCVDPFCNLFAPHVLPKPELTDGT